MADWVVYDAGAAAATLPPLLADAYGMWLTAEVRAERLGLIASGVVEDFRKAVAADADTTGKLDEHSIPASCLRHVSAVVWYALAQEMGSDPEPYRSGWQDSEIYLRRLYQDLKAGGAANGATGTPLYAPGSTVSGWIASPSGSLVYVPVSGSPINYSPPTIV